MAVGAYAAYNLWLRVPEINNLIVVFLFGGLMAAAVGILFGLPSLRIKGFYLAVATLASQFFLDWLFARVKWLTNYTPSGSVAVGELSVFGWKIDKPFERYLLILGIVVVATLVAKNLVRGHIGRSWMAIRDMDIAAEIIGFRPLRTKLTAFAVSSFFIGVAGAMWGFLRLGVLGAAGLRHQPLVPDPVHGHHRRPGLAARQLPGGGLHRADADRAQPASRLARRQDVDGAAQPPRIHGVRRDDRLLPDRRAAWPGPALGGRQGEVAALAVPALIH